MSEQRSRRHGVMNVAGTLRVLRDVTVQCDDDEFVAISRQGAAPGEVLTLERVVSGTTVSVPVRVIDSRPVIVSGSVRHRLRLGLLENARAERPTA